MNQSNIFTHIRQTSFHFVHLDRTGDRILTQTFHNQVIFLTCQLKIFFCFQEFFLCNQVFLIQLFLLVISTTVACHVDIQLCFFQLIVQFVLFHRHLCITKKVLLFRQLCLSIQDLQVEIWIGKTDNHIPFLHLCPFFHYFFLHDTTFFRAELHNRNGLYLTVHTNEIVKLLFRHIPYIDTAGIHFQCRSVITENNPSHQNQEKSTTCYIRNMLLLKTFLFF